MKRIVALIFVFTFLAAQEIGQTRVDDEEAYVSKVVFSLARPESLNLFQSAMWTVTHDYDDHAHMNAVIKSTFVFLEAIQKYQAGDRETFRKLGGVAAFRSKLTSLLDEKDESIRAFGASLIGISGDRTLAQEVAKLLADRPLEKDELIRYDRGRAAIALGMLDAVEFKSQIAKLLSSESDYDRSGAYSALADFHAVEFSQQAATQITKTNTMADDDVAAIDFLIQTGTAQKYKPQLVKTMLQPIRGERAEAAMYALVSIDAKEHAADIGKLLTDRFQKADAAKALALLGAKQYVPKIALLLRDESGLTRAAALLSLGILDANAYADRVAAGLTDREVYVRGYAAEALLLMKSKRHYPKVLEFYKSSDISDRTFFNDFPPAVAAKVAVIRDRLATELETARKVSKGTSSNL